VASESIVALTSGIGGTHAITVAIICARHDAAVISIVIFVADALTLLADTVPRTVSATRRLTAIIPFPLVVTVAQTIFADTIL
jgi:hypothetical protein